VGVTYKTAQQRTRQLPRRAAPVTTGERLIAAVAIVGALAILLATTGRLRALSWSDATAGDVARAPVDLNTVESASALEAPLAVVFESVAERRFAAATVFGALSTDGQRTTLRNVGALARIRVPAAAIDRAPGLDVLRARLHDARTAAAAASTTAPVSVPLLTAADLAAVKPALSVRTTAEFKRAVWWCALALLVSFPIVSILWRLRSLPGDRVLLAAIALLTTIGFVVMLTRPDPIRDTLLLSRFTIGVLIGLGAFALCSMAPLRTATYLRLSYLPLAGACALSIVLIVLGSGPGSSGAKVNLGPVQPIEGIRFLLALFMAGFFARRWELLRDVRAERIRSLRVPAWLDLPRADHVIPVVGGVLVALLLFFVQRDLGPALLLSLCFLSMYAIARRAVGGAAAGLALLVAGFYAGYRLHVSSTLAARVAMWQSAWDNAVRGGDQAAQAIWGLAAGAMSGTGLGLGHTRYVPEAHTDLVLAAIGEELGLAGLLVTAAAFAVIAWRGLRIARRSSGDYSFFLALAMTLSLVVPALVMGAGVLGLIPLTGVVTPFLSFGGSAMLVNFAAAGLLVAVRHDSPAPADHEPFHVPVRWLSTALAAAAGVMLAVLVSVQAVRADALLVRPQLSLQADGGRRFQYNPRVLEAVRAIPRGTIFDRRDLPLATDDPHAIQAAAASYERLGVLVSAACPRAGERCYPLGGPAFHLLGDASSQLNWSASNSSYVERDAQDLLRGFDDKATAVRTAAGDGTPAIAVRRDYSQIVPLVRHRYEPDHAAVKALLARSRDVHLTIDARLQLEASRLVSRAAQATRSGRAAAVILDAATGDILASVSYPWPALDARDVESPDDATLDRARYGLYPPGSTFKLVTAAAALRQDPAMGQRTFTCTDLGHGRVGAAIRGWARPVRDDVRDTHPHGTIDMRDAMVHSCNAYFAQLGVQIGADALSAAAAAAGVSLSTGTPGALKQTLPYAAYGQGEVVATPLRMARLAAAIGAGGQLRESPIVQGGARVEAPFLAPASADRLARYLREAVVSGTGRALKDHPARVAGKTGTAEVDDADSHAWFVGFAPAGDATRRIAFAVVMENAGYGGGAAASLAGQLVTAASAAGWVR
jgi:cell division protein FtsW (lipid II flippase)